MKTSDKQLEIPQQCPKVVALQASLLHECVVLSTWIQWRGTMACTLSTGVVFLPAKVSSLGAPLFRGSYNAGLCDWLVVLFVSVAGGTAEVLKTSLCFPVGNETSFPRFCGLWSAFLCFPLSLDHSDERGPTLVTYIYRFNVTIASAIHSVVSRPTAATTQRIIQVGLTAVGYHCAMTRHISPMETVLFQKRLACW